MFLIAQNLRHKLEDFIALAFRVGDTTWHSELFSQTYRGLKTREHDTGVIGAVCVVFSTVWKVRAIDHAT